MDVHSIFAQECKLSSCGHGTVNYLLAMQLLPQEEGYRLLELAASQGHLDAQVELSVILMKTKPLKAIRQLKDVADKGNRSARYILGVHYCQGQDTKRGFGYLKIAAHQGHAAARSQLGLCYLRGVGTDQDLAEAKSWIRMAALQGDATAIKLRVSYDNGTIIL